MNKKIINTPNRSSALQAQPGLTERIITASSKERPADAVLREEFRAQRDMMPSDIAAVSQTVFNYFRWRGWLDLTKPLPEQIRKSRELAKTFASDPDSFSDASLIERVAPEWLRGELEITADWARAIQAEPKLWLRAQPGQGRWLAEKLGVAVERRAPARRVDGGDDLKRAEQVLGAPLPDALHYDGEEDLFQRDEFHDGEFEIQDIASQAVGWICAPKPGETWWDTCAGEGGKTLHLSALMQNKGLIWASDRAEWRLKSLKRRAARAKVFNFRAVAWNGDKKPPTKTKFDGILVDAPCSGVGTWQRNPHARWTTDLQDVQELAAIQKRILSHAAPSVKPGGKLFYAVCTLTRSETTEVVADFNSKFATDFEPLVQENFSGTKFIWPNDLSGNGMFIAGWRRNAGITKVDSAGK